jgi:hypothetical protein
MALAWLCAAKVVKSFHELYDGVDIPGSTSKFKAVVTECRGDWKYQADSFLMIQHNICFQHVTLFDLEGWPRLFHQHEPRKLFDWQDTTNATLFVTFAQLTKIISWLVLLHWQRNHTYRQKIFIDCA